MAHWAEIDKAGKVLRVTVGDDTDSDQGLTWLKKNLGGVWKQTDPSTTRGTHKTGGVPYRGNFAAIGFTYDRVQDAFIPPKPTPDSTYDPATYSWLTPDPEGGPE